YLPERKPTTEKLEVPAIEDKIFARQLHPNEGTVVSTTQAYGAILQGLMRNKAIGKYIVPIIPDEARTFGMESFFSSFGIYSSKGQLYEPVDKLLPDGSASLMYYKEATAGQVLEEGIT